MKRTCLAGADVYKRNRARCVTDCRTNRRRMIAEGMAPRPPQLFHGTGVTDDEPWESYWKVEDGIRMTGMPGFKGKLSETQIWQATVLVKNADKISPAVKSALLREHAPTLPVPRRQWQHDTRIPSSAVMDLSIY